MSPKNQPDTAIFDIQSRHIHLAILIAILLLAALLRVWGINFGLPYTYHVDEPTYISAALNLGAGNIARQLNPPVLSNLLFLEYGAYYVIERLSGAIASITEFENNYRLDPSMFFILGRLTTALIGVLNVLIIYLIGKTTSNRISGMLAALFLALSFLHVRDSHFAVPDILMTFLVAVSVFFCLQTLHKTDRKYLYLAAFFSGMAIASKWSAWSLGIPLAYVFIMRAYKDRTHLPTSRIISSAAQAVLYFLAGFFIPAFQLILAPGSYLAYALTELQSGASGGFWMWQIDTVPGYIFYLKTLWHGIGPVLLILGVLGFLRHLWLAVMTRNEASILLLLFPLAYYLVMGATRHYFARYALPLIPFLVLFAGQLVVVTATQVESHWKKRGWSVLIGLALIASAQPLVNSLQFDFLMTQTDTRTLAKQWIEENIPVGSKIAMDWPIHSPVLSIADYDIKIEGEVGLGNHPIKYYREQGFDYLIASSFIYDIPLVIKQADQDRKVFYNSLDMELMLIKEFVPGNDPKEIPFAFDEIYAPFTSLWQRNAPGPILKIYRVSR